MEIYWDHEGGNSSGHEATQLLLGVTLVFMVTAEVTEPQMTVRSSSQSALLLLWSFLLGFKNKMSAVILQEPTGSSGRVRESYVSSLHDGLGQCTGLKEDSRWQ